MAELRVLIVAREPRVYLQPIRARFDDVRLESCSEPGQLASALEAHQPEVVLASNIGKPFPRDELMSFPSIRWIQCTSAGVDHLLPLEPGILVTSASLLDVRIEPVRLTLSRRWPRA